MFIKEITKDSRKFKRIRKYPSNSNLYAYFLTQQNLLISSEQMLMSAELKGCIALFIHFLNLPSVNYNCAKFHHCRTCVTDFREWGPKSTPPTFVGSPERALLNRVKTEFCQFTKDLSLIDWGLDIIMSGRGKGYFNPFVDVVQFQGITDARFSNKKSVATIDIRITFFIEVIKNSAYSKSEGKIAKMMIPEIK